tara:strand:- start:1195 stop:3102 length:1908 start_codon:yes stop_codon:yes gene_type:complete
MAQHDMDIANQGFPATRADINNALQALVSNSSGTSAPSTTFANQWWYDTTNNKLYIRNEANNAWIEVAVLDQTNNEWQITTGTIQAKDSDGLVFKTDDGTTRLSIADADGAVTMGSATLSTDGNEDTLVLKSNDADANAGPKLQFNRNSASAADADLIGETRYSGRNDASQAVDYARIRSQISDASDGTEDGQLQISTIVAGTMRSRVDFDATETVFNDASVDLDFRVESDNLDDALFVKGSDGNVGIGTDAPAFPLDCSTNSSTTNDAVTMLRLSANSSGTVANNFGAAINFSGEDASGSVRDLATINGIYTDATNRSSAITFKTRANLGSLTEVMRLTKDADVQIGTTTARPDNYNGSGSGTEISSAGLLRIARNGDMLVLNRVSTDGDMLNFSRDGSGVGQIGVSGGNNLYISGTQTDHCGLTFATNQILPTTQGTANDDTVDLGSSSNRYDDIYATNGTIQTSDENEKQNIASLTSAEITAATAISKLFKTFKWKSKVTAKGDDARTHTGVIAQQVETAMSDAGLDASKYAFWCSDTWWTKDVEVAAVTAVEAKDAVYDDDGNLVSEAVEAVEAQEAYTRTDIYHTKDEAPEGATERTRMGIRYPELLSFIGAATEQRLTSIEARLDALEG